MLRLLANLEAEATEKVFCAAEEETKQHIVAVKVLRRVQELISAPSFDETQIKYKR